VIGREARDAGMVASGASIKTGEPARRSTAKREPLDAADVPRRARTDAGGALGREARDAGMMASGSSIKLGERGEALHREVLDTREARSEVKARSRLCSVDLRV
jgi:hypothetical protein